MKDIVIVTGGGTGLGYALAEGLLKMGLEVCIVGRRAEVLENAKAALGTGIRCAAGDIADETFVKNLYADLAAEGYQVRYLFNNAGTGRFGVPEHNTRAMIDEALSGSLIGMILMSSNALPYMQAGGTIVNIMSTAGLRAKPKETVYCAAKWGARGFTESLKEAVKGTPVNVVGVYPGGMKTEFWSPDCGAVTDSSKFMDPADVADVILHAVSQRPGMAVSDLTIDRK